jgi:hypothetical protein
MKVCDQLHALAALSPRRNLGPHRTGGGVEPRTGIDILAKRKISGAYQYSNTKTFSLYSSLHTNSAILAPTYSKQVKYAFL